MRRLIDTAGTRVQLIATTNKAFRSFVNDQFYFPDELILSVKYLEKNNPLFIIGSQQSSYRITFFLRLWSVCYFCFKTIPTSGIYFIL